MAATNEPEPDVAKPTESPLPKILIGIAGLTAVLGFGMLFSVWTQSGVPDDQRKLSLAYEQYLDGHPFVAGKLAELVKFPPPVIIEEPETDDEKRIDEPEGSAESKAVIAMHALRAFLSDEGQSDVDLQSLRSFLLATDHFADPVPQEDSAERRKRLFAAVPFLVSAADSKFLPGRETEGVKLLGDAVRYIEQFQASDADMALRSLRAFLVGAGHAAKAEQSDDDVERRKKLHESVPFLAEAAELGFPLGREAEGHRMLGESLYHIGHFGEAADALRHAIERDLTLQRDLIPMMAQAELRSKSHGAEQSLRTIERYLQFRTLDLDKRRTAELIRLQALIDLRQWSEASTLITDELDAIESTGLVTDGALASFRDQLRLLDAKLQIDLAISRYGIQPSNLLAEHDLIARELDAAIRDLKTLDRESSPQTATHAKLLLADAYRCIGNIDDAISMYHTVQQQRPFGGDGIAGGLSKIEILALQGNGLEVVQTARYIMRELVDPTSFDPSIVSLDDFKDRVVEALSQLRLHGEYAAAIDTGRVMPPYFSPSNAFQEEGNSYSEWAAATLEEGRDASGNVPRAITRIARKRYRAAGDAFHEAALLEFESAQYPQLLWTAIEAYQKGRHFSRSIDLLPEYLYYEEQRLRPRGLIAQGRALLADNEPQAALETAIECLTEFPRDPLRYDARLLAAQAAIESSYAQSITPPAGEVVSEDAIDYLQVADRLLRDNLVDGDLTPESEAWKESLFTLADMAYQQASSDQLTIDADEGSDEDRLQILRDGEDTLQNAIELLGEAVDRGWPDPLVEEDTRQNTSGLLGEPVERGWLDPRAESAAYWLARCHLMASSRATAEAQIPSVLELVKRAARIRSDEQRDRALGWVIRLRKLYELEDEDQLSERQNARLLNCMMIEADILFDKKQIGDAAQAFYNVSVLYGNQPPALEAIMGQAKCRRVQGDDNAADALIRRASETLALIPEEWNGQFESMTRYSREEWEGYLGWVNTQLDANEA